MSGEELIDRVKKRAEGDDADAIYQLGLDYQNGENGLPQDVEKAVQLWHRAGELGHAKACHIVGNAYYHGRGVERDEKKAKHYWELVL